MRALRSILFAAALAIPAAAAHAQVGVYFQVGGPVRPVYREVVPPCPGPGYVWTAGYYDGGAWVPGRWYLNGGYGGYRTFAYADRDDFRYRDHDDWRGRDRDDSRDRDRYRHDRDDREHDGDRR